MRTFFDFAPFCRRSRGLFRVGSFFRSLSHCDDSCEEERKYGVDGKEREDLLLNVCFYAE